MRVEMAGMRRDAEHYSRQVICFLLRVVITLMNAIEILNTNILPNGVTFMVSEVILSSCVPLKKLEQLHY